MGMTKGQTFGSTEQVTNTKIHALVDSGTITVDHSELVADILSSLPSTTGTLPSHAILQSMASGATIKYDGSSGFYAEVV